VRGRGGGRGVENERGEYDFSSFYSFFVSAKGGEALGTLFSHCGAQERGNSLTHSGAETRGAYFLVQRKDDALKLLQQYVSKPSSSIYGRIFTNYILNRLSERDEMRDKLGPSFSYFQKLGPEYLDQIF
jgi:hypothetical protein